MSERAGCKFCIDLNQGVLSNLGADLDAVHAAREDIDQAPVSDAEKPLLKLALQAVDAPDQDSEPLVEAARAAGWGDREIFDAVMQAASNRAFNFVLKTFNVEAQGAFG